MTLADKILRAKADYDEVYEAGKIDGGALYYVTNFNNVFGGTSFPENYECVIKVKYVPTQCGWMFNNCKYPKTIKLICEAEQTTAINFESAFAVGSVTPNLELLDLAEFCKKFNGRVNTLCNKQTLLHTIKGALDFTEVTLTINAFGSCSSLTEIEFVPNCIYVNLSFANSPLLDDASRQSIIDGLADLTGLTSQKIEFHSDVLAKLTTEQADTIAAKNWTT